MGKNMRLFAAIDLPEVVKVQLAALRTSMPTARWVGREQMHLTLFFIGETERLDAVKDALAGVQAGRFEMALSGVGRFPPAERRPPRVLWAGVDAPPALRQLQAQVTEALVGSGFSADDRPFSPHITLARLKAERPLAEVNRFLEQQRDFQTASFPVEQFTLFSSTLTPQGARYAAQAVYPLRI